MRYTLVVLVLALSLTVAGCDSDAGMDAIHGPCSETADCGDGDSCISGRCITCYDVAYQSWHTCDSCTWAAEIGGRTVEECRAMIETNMIALEGFCDHPVGMYDGSHAAMFTCYAEGRCDCE